MEEETLRYIIRKQKVRLSEEKEQLKKEMGEASGREEQIRIKKSDKT